MSSRRPLPPGPATSPRPAFLQRSALAPLLVLLLVLAACSSPPAEIGPVARERAFVFTYEATVTDLQPGQEARIWLPVAQSSRQQIVDVLETEAPGEARTTVEKRYGNRLLYVEARADAQGRIPLKVSYQVLRQEVLPTSGDTITDEQETLFLSANALVPLDAPQVQAFKGNTDTTGPADQVALRYYDLVGAELNYDKPDGGAWGRGDTVWVCDAKHGNCTDFHSLFIALCRSSGIPARFEMGFPLPTEIGQGQIGGYHCWAWFGANDRWTACDISEADKHPELKTYYFGSLTPDRVAFTVGRDLLLEPPQAGPPVNFLVYPYVEVDGQPWSSMQNRYSYRDL